MLQLGDFGVWTADSGKGYLDVLSFEATQADVTVLFIDGNHFHGALGPVNLSEP